MGGVCLKLNPGVVMALVMMCLCGAARYAEAEEFDCILEPHQVVRISSPVPGVIDAVLAGRGDHVKKNQILVRLKSGVQKAEVGLARIKAAFDERKAERNKRMHADKLISESDMDELKTKAKVSEAELRVAKAKLEQRTIRSPISGVILERFHSPGEFVRDDKIIKLAETNPLNVEVIVPASMLNEVKKGMNATVALGSMAAHKYQGKVVVVDPVVDAASGTVGIRLEIPNPAYKIPSGSKCKIELNSVTHGVH